MLCIIIQCYLSITVQSWSLYNYAVCICLIWVDTRNTVFHICFLATVPTHRLADTGAVTFTPIPLPKRVLQTSDRSHFFYGDALQTVLGMGMGMDVTAQEPLFSFGELVEGRPRARSASAPHSAAGSRTSNINNKHSNNNNNNKKKKKNDNNNNINVNNNNKKKNKLMIVMLIIKWK